MYVCKFVPYTNPHFWTDRNQTLHTSPPWSGRGRRLCMGPQYFTFPTFSAYFVGSACPLLRSTWLPAPHYPAAALYSWCRVCWCDVTHRVLCNANVEKCSKCSSAQDNSRSVHCTGVISEKCTQHCPHTTGIQQCVCMVGTKIHDRSSWKLMFGGAVSLLQSFKGGANGFPQSMVTLWDVVSLFYSKWASMQWTYPSSLTATKCKVCQGAWRQWHLYSVLQESSREHTLWHAVLTVLGY
jgi:hypothetical protein